MGNKSKVKGAKARKQKAKGVTQDMHKYLDARKKSFTEGVAIRNHDLVSKDEKLGGYTTVSGHMTDALRDPGARPLEDDEREDQYVKGMLNAGGKSFHEFVKKAAPGVFDKDIDFLSVDDVKRKQADSFTLADEIHRLTYHPAQMFGNTSGPQRRAIERALEKPMIDLRMKLRSARRFSLEDHVVRECVRKAGDKPARIVERAEMLKLPFERMWVEYSNGARLDAINEYRQSIERPRYSDHEWRKYRAGFLLERVGSPNGSADVVLATAFTSDEDGIYGVAPVGYLLGAGASSKSFDLHPNPEIAQALRITSWGYGAGEDEEHFAYALPDERLLDLGCPTVENFVTGPALATKNLNAEHTQKLVFEGVNQGRGDMRFILTLMQMINVVPIKKVYAQAVQTHYNYKGKNVPYLDHQIVSIEVGKTKVIKVVDHAFRQAEKEHARKRAHEVRGHFRVYHKGTKEERRTWIKAHQRGDASLGFVRQTWEVTA